MRAVQIEASKLFSRDVDLLSKVSAIDIVSAAVASGDCETLRGILRKDGLDDALKRAFRHMQAAQRTVRGSEASKTSLQNKFTAVRLWSGCSSLFFTLNPYARQPLTLALCSGDHLRVENFSLDLSDVGVTEFFAGVKQARLGYCMKSRRRTRLQVVSVFMSTPLVRGRFYAKEHTSTLILFFTFAEDKGLSCVFRMLPIIPPSPINPFAILKRPHYVF